MSFAQSSMMRGFADRAPTMMLETDFELRSIRSANKLDRESSEQVVRIPECCLGIKICKKMNLCLK